MTIFTLPHAADAASQAKISEIARKTDSKFVLHYFEEHMYVTSIRSQLAVANANWENVFHDFDTFVQFKSKHPFGTLPVLHETTSDGDTLIVPESGCIQRYLASKFGQMGSNECQAMQIEAILSLAQGLVEFWTNHVVTIGNDELQASNKKLLYEQRLPTWLSYMEKIAVNNGSSGHLVGDKFTLADLKTVSLLDGFLAMDTEGSFRPETYPALFKVKQKVDTHPRYAEYRKCEGYAKLSANDREYYGTFKLDVDFAKAKLYD